jgi:hypothetical protein
MYVDPDYQYSVSIEGVNRIFRFVWNERNTSWHLDISNDDGTVIVRGLRLVPQTPLLGDYAASALDITGYLVLLPYNLNTRGMANNKIEDIPNRYGLVYTYTVDDGN